MNLSNITLKEQYEFALKVQTIAMPIAALAFVVMGIVFCIKFTAVLWVGLILIGLGLGVIGLYFGLRAYVKKKIAQLDAEEKTESNDVPKE